MPFSVAIILFNSIKLLSLKDLKAHFFLSLRPIIYHVYEFGIAFFEECMLIYFFCPSLYYYFIAANFHGHLITIITAHHNFNHIPRCRIPSGVLRMLNP